MGYFVIKGDGHQSIDRIDIPPRWGFPTSGTPDIHWPKCPKQMQGRRNVLVEQNMDFYLYIYIYICVCVNLCLPIPRMQIYGYLFLDCCSWHQSSFVWGEHPLFDPLLVRMQFVAMVVPPRPPCRGHKSTRNPLGVADWNWRAQAKGHVPFWRVYGVPCSFCS